MKKFLKKLVSLPKDAAVKAIALPLLNAIFKSKKLGIALTAVIVLLLTQVGLPENVAQWIAGTLVGWIFSQGAVDVALVLKGLKTA